MKQLAVLLSVIAVLAGCSGASNSGGATTCGEFTAMRSENMDATVARMLKERNGRNSSTMDVINTRITLIAACGAPDKGDVTIGDLA